MEGQNSHDNFPVAPGKYGDHPFTPLLFPRVHPQEAFQDHGKFPVENSKFLQWNHSNGMPVGSRDAVNWISETPRDILRKNFEKTSRFTPNDSSYVMEALKVKPYVRTSNDSNNYEASMYVAAGDICYNQTVVKDGESYNLPVVRFGNPLNEGELMSNFATTEYQIIHQNYASWTQELNEGSSDVSEPYSRVTIAVPGNSTKSAKSIARQRATATDRRRRSRIAERLKALQELLPHPEKGSKASLLDDIIDHIKYLQLQIKDLSQNRLGGESTSAPVVFLEGYGHYFPNDHSVNEPLEETMGKLLEINPTAASLLLDSRGLSIMPLPLAEGLPQVL